MLKRLWLNLRLFFQGALLSYVALFRWLRPSAYLASKIVSPLFQLFFFTFLGVYATGQDNASFYVIGNSLQITAMSGIYGVTMSIGGDRWDGTLPYLFGTPANRMAIFIGRALFHILDGMLGVFLALMWGVLLLGLDLTLANPLVLSLIILITTVSTSALGLMMGCLGLITRNIMVVNNSVYFVLLVFSGANVPLEVLPGFLRSISDLLPLTRGIAAARQVVAGSGMAEVAPLMVGELLVALVYFLIGFLMFRWFEQQAKRRGTLEAF